MSQEAKIMPESGKKYRLITRSDMDGLVCGVLLKEMELIEDITFAHPKDMQDGLIEVGPDDITTNLPYVEGVYIAFDHHSSEVTRLEDCPYNHVIDPDAPSAARVVYQYFGGAVPPDLSVTARSRGVDWLYTYFMTFYLDPSRPFGVNNLAFKDVGMPHVLWELQGWQRAIYEVREHANGSVTKEITNLELETEGLQTEEEYARTVRDLVNFMDYLGEPIKLKRQKIGFWAIFYLLLVLLPIVYLLKKEYWKDVH